jgi:signal peptidase II
MAFILGGALGNVYDRFIHGYVIDFIDFHTSTWHFATFNLADSAINVGVAIWLIGIYKKSRENPANSR